MFHCCIFFIAHARSGRISTSGLKSLFFSSISALVFITSTFYFDVMCYSRLLTALECDLSRRISHLQITTVSRITATSSSYENCLRGLLFIRPQCT